MEKYVESLFGVSATLVDHIVRWLIMSDSKSMSKNPETKSDTKAKSTPKRLIHPLHHLTLQLAVVNRKGRSAAQRLAITAILAILRRPNINRGGTIFGERRRIQIRKKPRRALRIKQKTLF